MSWAAIGDVEGLLLNTSRDGPQKRTAVVQRGGILGHHMPSVMPQTNHLESGDVIVMSSDGIRHAHRDAIATAKSAENLAEEALDLYGRENDDALVLVIKCDDAQ